jgi:hypothetical protein
MGPWGGLVESIAAAVGPLHVSVLAGPVPQLVPDAIMVRPDEPWISHLPRFTGNLERYVAICATRVSAPAESMDKLYAMAGGVLDALTEGWAWESVSALAIDETTDTPLLVATVRLTYTA